MTDSTPPNGGVPEPRPRPQYGEYAPPGWVSPFAEAEPAAAASGPDLRHLPPPTAPAVPRWDRPVTMVLVALGFLGTFMAWLIGGELQQSLPLAMQQYGIDVSSVPDSVGVLGTVMWVSHVALYVFTVLLVMQARRAGRRTFAIPLIAGVIAAIVFWTCMSIAVGPYAGMLQP